VIETVQEIINEEMDAVVEELKEESDVTEENVLGMMIGDIQEVVRVIAPVFYSLVRTAAWSKKQEEPSAKQFFSESGKVKKGAKSGYKVEKVNKHEPPTEKRLKVGKRVKSVQTMCHLAGTRKF
jgi:hypothetical protein